MLMTTCNPCKVARWKIRAVTLRMIGHSMASIKESLTVNKPAEYYFEIREQVGVKLLVCASPYGVDVLLREKTDA